MNATATSYTTRGNVRGSCGHQHGSLRTAAECVARDSRMCRKQGGYSDRKVVYADGSRLVERDFLDAQDWLARAQGY